MIYKSPNMEANRIKGKAQGLTLDNAFMFSLIESCKLNGLVPEKYIAHLLRQLKGEPTEKEKAALLTCCCAL